MVIDELPCPKERTGWLRASCSDWSDEKDWNLGDNGWLWTPNSVSDSPDDRRTFAVTSYLSIASGISALSWSTTSKQEAEREAPRRSRQSCEVLQTTLRSS